MRFGDDSLFGFNGSNGGANSPSVSNNGTRSISLKKGEKISLTKKAPKLRTAQVGLGWSCPDTVNGRKVDLDASAILFHSDGKAYGLDDFTFYGHPDCYNGAVKSSGDSLGGGSGDTDDETLFIDFAKVPADIFGIAICVSIYEYRKRRHNFGLVNSAYVRVVNSDTGDEEIRYDLMNDFTTETGLIVCKFLRGEDGWEMEASGTGVEGGLSAIGSQFGLDLDDEN